MVPPTQLPLGSRASSRSSPATANSFWGAFASSACKSETLISVPLRFFIRRPSFRLPKKTTAKLPDAVARRSWVLRGVNYAGVAEEARTRGFVPPAFTGFDFGAAGAASYKSDIPRGPGGVKDPRRGLLRTHPVP